MDSSAKVKRHIPNTRPSQSANTIGALLSMTPAFKKILIVSSEFPPNVGGIGNHAYNLARALTQEGFELTVVTDIIDVSKQELQQFSSKQNFRIHWIERKKFVVHSYVLRVVKALALTGDADKVILSGKFPLWLATLIRLRYKAKELIAVVHGTELDLKSTMAKSVTAYSLGKFNKIISVSNYTRQFLPKYLPQGIGLFVIPNGINGAEFNIFESASLAGHPALITVGNVTDRKGQENVINALPEIILIYPSVCYHIVGKPTNRAKMEALARRLGVEKNIVFHGAVGRDELLQKLKAADIKLMLSNHTSEGDFEGFGIAVLEANAFGVPAIGSKNSGIADAIDNGRTGVLVDQHCSEEVAGAVKQIMNNYPGFSKNAKRWAQQHDWKNIVMEYVEALSA